MPGSNPLLRVLLTCLVLLAAGRAPAVELPDFTTLVEQYAPAVVSVSARTAAAAVDDEDKPGKPTPNPFEGTPFEEPFRRFFEQMPHGNSPRPRESVARQLDGIGVARSAYDGIVSSGDVSRSLIEDWAGEPIQALSGGSTSPFMTSVSGPIRAPSPMWVS